MAIFAQTPFQLMHLLAQLFHLLAELLILCYYLSLFGCYPRHLRRHLRSLLSQPRVLCLKVFDDFFLTHHSILIVQVKRGTV